MPGVDRSGRALDVHLPLAGEQIVLSVSDTAARFVIPAALAGKPCTVVIDGTDCDILAGDSAVVCAYGTASGVASMVITPDATSGMHFVNGVPQRVRFPKQKTATHFSVDCKGSGSGKLYITPE